MIQTAYIKPLRYSLSLIFLGFFLILMILLSTSYLSLTTLSHENQKFERLIEHDQKKLNLFNKMRDAVWRRFSSLFLISSLRDKITIEEEWERFTLSASQFMSARTALIQMGLNTQEKTLLEIQRPLIKDTHVVFLKIIAHARVGHTYLAQKNMLIARNRAQRLMRILDESIFLNKKYAKIRMQEARVAYEKLRNCMIFLSMAAVVCCIIVVMGIAEKIRRQQLQFIHTLDKLKDSNQQLFKRSQELMVAQHKADIAHQAKTRFLANISHELRTPLNAVLGYTEILLYDIHSHGHINRTDEVEEIRKAGHNLLKLVTDLLDIADLDDQKVQVYHQRFELYPLIDGLLETMKPHIKNQHNELSVKFDPNIDWINGDPDRIKQILLNLLSNAVKFTQNGLITLQVKKQIRYRQHWVVCQVIDNGIGIDRKEQKQLFQLFHQVDDSPTRPHGGLGISLALSLRFARMMHGDLTLESQLGKGSCFTLWLPESY